MRHGGSGVELSPFHVATEVRANDEGMMMATATAAWQHYHALRALQLSLELLGIAAHAKPKTLVKHPRGPKPPAKNGCVFAADARRRVSTASVLKEKAAN